MEESPVTEASKDQWPIDLRLVDWFSLIWFYGISIIVGYLMPNPVFTYILNKWFANTFCRYTVKWSNSSISNYSI